MSEKERQIAFWDKHRAAMDRLKRDRDPQSAALLFREALALDPRHEDGRYYLASCLASMGQTQGAIKELEALLAVNPSSHRALQRLAYLHAQTARSKADLQTAAAEAGRAHALNPEETGALLLLAEIELLRGNPAKSRVHLESVIRSNHRAALAYFLLAYLDSRSGDTVAKRVQLEATVKARGPEWKPKGSVHEGDVQRQMHEETSLLMPYADLWDGKQDPRTAFAALENRLSGGA
jgi:tetratricopeptide (TPR) repeat protein